MEEPITFRNRQGKKLFGIVHIPDNSPSAGERIGINLLNPGIKYRVAPHRLSMKLARRLCQKGYHVLRFDPSGIGDSDGELPENFLIHDIWGRIQTGLFVNDTITANDFFIKHYELSNLILVGSCGGAITSLLTSAKDRRVNALCLIDVPVFLLDSKSSFAEVATKDGEKADWFFSEYTRKLFRPGSWYRFVSLKTDYRALGKILLMQFQRKIGRRKKDERLPSNLEKLCQENKLNKLFFESFEALVENGKHILFISAGNDPGFETFQNYFQNYYLKNRLGKGSHDSLTEVFVILGSNHIYTLKEWQESLIDKVSSWIGNHSQSFQLRQTKNSHGID
jgi:pimeloyl-ACP methyl ester carboxylesterase